MNHQRTHTRTCANFTQTRHNFTNTQSITQILVNTHIQKKNTYTQTFHRNKQTHSMHALNKHKYIHTRSNTHPKSQTDKHTLIAMIMLTNFCKEMLKLWITDLKLESM